MKPAADIEPLSPSLGAVVHDVRLDANPDAETRGNLLINKAMILHYSRKTPQAIEILGDLYLGNGSTLATRVMSQMALAALMR